MIDLGDPSAITQAIDGGNDWLPYPTQGIELLDGNPSCRMKLLRVRGLATPIHRALLLEITPGRFRWSFKGDESWITLSGRCMITLDTGEALDCRPGHMASVPAGRQSVWEVHETFVKFVVNTSGVSAPPMPSDDKTHDKEAST